MLLSSDFEQSVVADSVFIPDAEIRVTRPDVVDLVDDTLDTAKAAKARLVFIPLSVNL